MNKENKELIAAAVARRLSEVSERVNQLDPERFGAAGFYLSSVKEVLRGSPFELKAKLPPFLPIKEWAAADTDCLTALRLLSLHGPQAKSAAAHPPADEFLKELKAKTSARERLFASLTDRYSWPLNLSLGTESEICEYLLRRLMTSIRRQIEKALPSADDADDLFLQLNLIAVHACATTDLRFLDALNYYYELLPANWHPESENGWLLVSWLALYARALAAWS